MNLVNCGPDWLIDLDDISLVALNGKVDPPNPSDTCGTVTIFRKSAPAAPLTLTGPTAVYARAHLRTFGQYNIGVPASPPAPGPNGPQPVDPPA